MNQALLQAAIVGINKSIEIEQQAIKDYAAAGDLAGEKAAQSVLRQHKAYKRGLEFALSLGEGWINEQQQRPALCQPVIISVMRRAQLITDGDGSVKWHLRNSDHPIDLEKDVVYWLPDTE